MKKKAMYKGPDGREFVISFSSQEELLEAIAEIRKQNGYPDPAFLHAIELAPSAGAGIDSINTADLPEHIREDLIKDTKEQLAKPDPKKMN